MVGYYSKLSYKYEKNNIILYDSQLYQKIVSIHITSLPTFWCTAPH